MPSSSPTAIPGVLWAAFWTTIGMVFMPLYTAERQRSVLGSSRFANNAVLLYAGLSIALDDGVPGVCPADRLHHRVRPAGKCRDDCDASDDDHVGRLLLYRLCLDPERHTAIARTIAAAADRAAIEQFAVDRRRVRLDAVRRHLHGRVVLANRLGDPGAVAAASDAQVLSTEPAESVQRRHDPQAALSVGAGFLRRVPRSDQRLYRHLPELWLRRRCDLASELCEPPDGVHGRAVLDAGGVSDIPAACRGRLARRG